MMAGAYRADWHAGGTGDHSPPPRVEEEAFRESARFLADQEEAETAMRESADLMAEAVRVQHDDPDRARDLVRRSGERMDAAEAALKRAAG